MLPTLRGNKLSPIALTKKGLSQNALIVVAEWFDPDKKQEAYLKTQTDTISSTVAVFPTEKNQKSVVNSLI